MYTKDTQACYDEHQEFFDRIDKNVKQIISIGFSYADVDMYYIEKIIESVGSDVVWNLYKYKLKETLCFKYKLRKYGFHGKIKMFTNLEGY